MNIFLTLFLNILSLTCWATKLPDAQINGIQEVKKWARLRLKDAEAEFRHWRPQYYPSLNQWTAGIVYQIQVDRFANGNPANDTENLPRMQREESAQGVPWNVFEYRHGGDLAGITQRLDYLATLGVNLLWITPIVKHDGSYHGYCTTDFSQIDPGFGSAEELREMVAQAHARGIRVVMDVVINHMCDPDTKYIKVPNHKSCSAKLWQDHWTNGPVQNDLQGQLGFSENFFAPFRDQRFFNRCGDNTQEEMQGEGPETLFGDFVSTMFDFNTRSPDFQEIFTDIHKYWIAYAVIDGLRLDAAKHTTEDFIAYFSTHVRDYARSLGKDNFLVVGEVAGSSPWQGRRVGRMFTNPFNPDDHGDVPQTLTQMLWQLQPKYLSHPYAQYPGQTATYDFAHGGKARDFFQGLRDDYELKHHFDSEYYLTLAGQKDPRENWSLLEIHDWPRFASQGPGDVTTQVLAATYLLTAEGVPIIYYGFEQGLNGKCQVLNHKNSALVDYWKKMCAGHDHSLYRQDMFMQGPFRLGSIVPEINGLADVRAPLVSEISSPCDDPYLNTEHSLFQHISKLTKLRSNTLALREGVQEFFQSPSGVIAFSRAINDQEVLVFINTRDESVSINGAHSLHLPVGKKIRRWQSDQEFVVGPFGQLSPNQLQLAPKEFVILY